MKRGHAPAFSSAAFLRLFFGILGHLLFQLRMAGIEPFLLRDGQDVRHRPVELQTSGKRRHDEHQDPWHEAENLSAASGPFAAGFSLN